VNGWRGHHAPLFQPSRESTAMPSLGTAIRTCRTPIMRADDRFSGVRPDAPPPAPGARRERIDNAASGAEATGSFGQPLVLWNPMMAAVLSLAFTPLFGALLHCFNALELGERRLRHVAWMWLALALAFTASGLYLVAPDRWQLGSGFSASALLSGYTTVWYAFAGRKQSRLLNRLGRALWRPRSFVLPVVLALVCMSLPGLSIWWQARG
jgi:hypothetical protein